MNTYEIDENREITFEPVDEIEEICQNVSLIIRTIKGTFFMSRSIGIEDPQDKPINIMEAELSASIAEEIGEYEPRCKLKGIKYDYENDEVKIKVVVEIGK